MKRVLLIGAGFSRNWGGWLADEVFEYLLGSPQIFANHQLSKLLWKHRVGGGFEAAVAEAQNAWVLDHARNLNNLLDLQAAVGQMFHDMNAGFAKRPFEFQQGGVDVATSVMLFLTRFDAIFTLNQDLLLERHYCAAMATARAGVWSGCEMPGMRRIPSNEHPADSSWATCRWSPLPADEYRVSGNCQPIFKLHGSSEWYEMHGEQLMIIGGDKLRKIGHHPVLQRYFEEFERSLAEPDTRLMVIGYGFRDHHINEVLIRELSRTLRLFLITPEGTGVARSVSPNLGGQIYEKSTLEQAFEKGLMGASRRWLHELFGGDSVEFSKVMRFFQD